MVIDVWSMLLRAFGVRSLDFCLLGRWVMHMPGRVLHESIGAAAAKPHECKVGWTAHYSIGIGFAIVFVLLMGERWLSSPTFLPAFGFGLLTVAVPFFTLQPALGLGVASSRTKHPNAARLKSISTHAAFGIGLFLSGSIWRWLSR